MNFLTATTIIAQPGPGPADRGPIRLACLVYYLDLPCSDSRLWEKAGKKDNSPDDRSSSASTNIIGANPCTSRYHDDGSSRGEVGRGLRTLPDFLVKSTLIKCVSTPLEAYQEGHILVDGIRWSGKQKLDRRPHLRRRGSGMVFQKFRALSATSSVIDNICLAQRGCPQAPGRKEAEGGAGLWRPARSGRA